MSELLPKRDPRYEGPPIPGWHSVGNTGLCDKEQVTEDVAIDRYFISYFNRRVPRDAIHAIKISTPSGELWGIYVNEAYRPLAIAMEKILASMIEALLRQYSVRPNLFARGDEVA